uniref:CSON008756 protein n=1 Tax=Culicoides sonorensis TaxID=179676 RepID=A0A336M4J7_CULSO
MISLSKRTIFAFKKHTSKYVTLKKTPQIICILLLLLLHITTQCSASILPSSSSSISSSHQATSTYLRNEIANNSDTITLRNDTNVHTRNRRFLTSTPNNVNTDIAMGKQHSEELTNQSALARKFDDTDLIPSTARTFLNPLRSYFNTIVRNLVRYYTTFTWFEPEIEFGSCIYEQRFHTNPKEAARGAMLNILHGLLNQLRGYFSNFSFQMGNGEDEEHHEEPPIDFSYYEQHPSVEKLAVYAAEAAVQHQINTQVPTRPPLIKFIPPMIRPNFGGLLNRRQGRHFMHDKELKKNEEEKIINNDENVDIIDNSENNGGTYTRVKRYRRETNFNHQRKVLLRNNLNNNHNNKRKFLNQNMMKRPENVRLRRQEYYYNPPTQNAPHHPNNGINPVLINHAMISPPIQSHHPNTIQYTPHQMQNYYQYPSQQQQLSYQEFHLPKDQEHDSYKGTLFDANEYVDGKPISVDLQQTYTNWVDDFETLILNKFGMGGKSTSKSGGYLACAQSYTFTLVLRFIETLISKMLFL